MGSCGLLFCELVWCLCEMRIVRDECLKSIAGSRRLSFVNFFAPDELRRTMVAGLRMSYNM